jgi:hypothetical protein
LDTTTAVTASNGSDGSDAAVTCGSDAADRYIQTKPIARQNMRSLPVTPCLHSFPFTKLRIRRTEKQQICLKNIGAATVMNLVLI